MWDNCVQERRHDGIWPGKWSQCLVWGINTEKELKSTGWTQLQGARSKISNEQHENVKENIVLHLTFSTLKIEKHLQKTEF